jgi:amino-acid N-acetyltransferase
VIRVGSAGERPVVGGRSVGLLVGPARPNEAEAIAELVRPYAEKGLMLPREPGAVLAAIHGYRVVRDRDGGIVGCAGLRPFHGDLAEIVAFAVHREWQGRGVGTELLVRIVDEALMAGYGRLFAMTLRPGPFERIGFREVARARVPEKIARDCAGCPFQAGCRERTLLLDVRPFLDPGEVPGPTRTLALAGPIASPTARP